MQVGDVLDDRYELLRHIDSGGFADVYAAFDSRVERHVAIKVLRDQFSDPQDTARRLDREAKLHGKLNHQHVVTLYDSGVHNQRPFLVMELVEGQTLRDELDEPPALAEPESVRIASQVADALDAAHGQGVLHRDIKPGNILLTDDRTVKVTDFGISRAIFRSIETESRIPFGTPAYISPEQSEGQEADARADVYSLGVVLYEMLTGQVPFHGDSPEALCYQHVNVAPTPPQQINPKVSGGLNAIVLRMLEKDPDRRYPDAAALRDDLQAASEGRHVAATNAPPVQPDATTTRVHEPAPSRRGRWVALAGATAVVLMGAWLLPGLLAGDGLAEGETDQPGSQLVQVPDVEGDDIDTAETKLERTGLQLGTVEEVTAQEPAGTVVAQDPASGEDAPDGSRVDLEVAGEVIAIVPNLDGRALDDAETELAEVGLQLGQVDEEPSDTVDPGRVVAQSVEPEDSLPGGSEVDVTVSGGPAPVAVPDVSDGDENAATRTLEDAGFDVQIRTQTASEPAGTVLRQSPAVGEDALPGSTVTVTVSRGPDPVRLFTDDIRTVNVQSPSFVYHWDITTTRIAGNEFSPTVEAPLIEDARGWLDYNIGGQGYTTLHLHVGLSDDSERNDESVRFLIIGDGTELASEDVEFDELVEIEADVTDVNRLRLEVVKLRHTANRTADPSSIAVFAEPTLR